MQPLWNVGVPMAALNYQTDGLPMDLNSARFRSNGGCGYVLKPTFLRDPDILFNPHLPRGIPVEGSSGPAHLTVTVVSAQSLPVQKVFKLIRRSCFLVNSIILGTWDSRNG